MKKFLAILLSALLALSAVSAVAEVTLTPYAEVEDASVISGSDLLKLSLKNGYALAAMDGTQLTDAIYGSSMYSEKGWITASKPSEDDYQTHGVLNAEGEEVVPFKYGDVKIKNSKWALAFTLVLATADNYDYSSWGNDNTYYLIDTVDVYYLPEAKCVATIARTNFKDCTAIGDYINIEDRATGVVTTYDSAFNALGEVKYTSSDDFVPHYTTFSDNGQKGLVDPDGNVVLPASYKYVDNTIHDGYYTVSTGDLYGLADLEGNVVVPAEYDRILTSYYSNTEDYSSPYVVNGYVAVDQGGKLGYYSLTEGVTCEPRYARDNLDNHGMCAQFTDMAGNINLLAADGVETALEGYDRVYPLDGAGGLLYRVNDSDYNYGVIDWHGNVVLPVEYDDADISGSGKYLAVKTDYNAPTQIFEVAWTPDAASAEAPKEGGEEGEAAAPASTSAAALILDNVVTLLNADPAANGVAAATLLQTVVDQITDNDAAKTVLNSAITLLNTDSAANGASVLTLLESVRGML